MSLLSVVKDVCAVVGVNPPTTMFGSVVSPRDQFEILSLANEMAQRIAYDVREWTQMKSFATYTGDGVKDRFPLPADYLRMLLTANVWPSWMARQPLVYISDTDEWLMRRQSQVAVTVSEWTLLGTNMLIYPVLPSGHTVSFAYLGKNCIDLRAPNGDQNGYSDAFVSDLDRFMMPERLLKLGMIWQWKANKGSPYAEDMGTYTDALFMLAGSNKPAPVIVDNLPISRNATVALPWPNTWGVPAP